MNFWRERGSEDFEKLFLKSFSSRPVQPYVEYRGRQTQDRPFAKLNLSLGYAQLLASYMGDLSFLQIQF